MVLAPTRHPRNGFSRELENYTGEEAVRKPMPSGIFLCVFTLNLASNCGQLLLTRTQSLISGHYPLIIWRSDTTQNNVVPRSHNASLFTNILIL